MKGSYRIRWKQSATKELRKLPRALIPRVLEAVEGLATDPRPHGTRKLAGTEHSYRLRIGDYRVVYSIEDEVLTVHVVRIAHRRDVYR